MLSFHILLMIALSLYHAPNLFSLFPFINFSVSAKHCSYSNCFCGIWAGLVGAAVLSALGGALWIVFGVEKLNPPNNGEFLLVVSNCVLDTYYIISTQKVSELNFMSWIGSYVLLA